MCAKGFSDVVRSVSFAEVLQKRCPYWAGIGRWRQLSATEWFVARIGRPAWPPQRTLCLQHIGGFPISRDCPSLAQRRSTFAALPPLRATFEPPITLCLPPFSCSRSDHWRPSIDSSRRIPRHDRRHERSCTSSPRAGRGRADRRGTSCIACYASDAVRDRAGDQRRDSDHYGRRQVSEAWLANRSSRIGARTFQRVPLVETLSWTQSEKSRSRTLSSTHMRR